VSAARLAPLLQRPVPSSSNLSVSPSPHPLIPTSVGLSSLGQLDSLGRVELLSALEDRYQIEIDEASFTAATTLGDIERIVRGGGEPEAASHYPYPAWTQRFPFTWLRLPLLS